MKLAHFNAFAPICPVCRQNGREAALVIAEVAAGDQAAISAGLLHCSACRHEYPILDGIPLIVPRVATLIAERGVELLLRDDLPGALESLIGDAIGPDSWFDMMRQVQSTYAWDGYGDLDPEEQAQPGGPVPGAARRCLSALLGLSAPRAGMARLLDLGCAAGRTSFDLAAAHPGALVLGADLHLGVLRLAQQAASGRLGYPRRRIGLVYDRRAFDVALPGAERVDFWACDATALPFRAGQADLCLGLNLLDCVPDPRALLESLARVTRPGGHVLLSTPYDWSTRATPVGHWLGGHSQRAAHRGAGEPFLQALLEGAADHAVTGLALRAEQADFPWHTRLHERSAVQYRTHLLALARG